MVTLTREEEVEKKRMKRRRKAEGTKEMGGKGKKRKGVSASDD